MAFGLEGFRVFRCLRCLVHPESFRAAVVEVEAVEDSVEDELDVTVVTGT